MTRAQSRRAQRTVGRRRIHDVKQRSVVRSRGALLRPGLSVSSQVPTLSASAGGPHGGSGASGRRDFSNSVPPMRGGWSADSLTLNFGRACDARPPIPGRPGITLGAPPWRFSDADPRSRLPAVEPEPAATSRARPYDWRSGSGPPCGAVRAASAGRHSRLRLAGSFLENAPSEPGYESLYYKLDT